MNRNDLLNLLHSLSVEEKVSQLCQVDMQSYLAEASSATGPMAQPQKHAHGVGSVICGGNADAEKFAEVQECIRNQSPHGIPTLFMSDVIHGFRTIFPIPLALGCTFDPNVTETMARVSARECSASGIHVTFAPMADVVRDPRWGRSMESAGESPRLCGEMAAATVRGFQGESLQADDSVACCVKHFAGYALVEAGREYAAVDVSRMELYNTYFPPFRAALDAGCKMLMPAFTPVERIPAVMNSWLLKTVLREQWGFDGMVISDWGAVGELITHGVAPDLRDAARRSIMAGNDMDMMSGAYAEKLEELVKHGLVPMERLDEAVLRVLSLKNELGLFENACKHASRKDQDKAFHDPTHRHAALQAALKSCVLLQNRDALPLKAGTRVALAGDHAQTNRLLGSWIAGGRSEETASLREAFEAHVTILPPEEADVILFATGEDQDDTGEAASKTKPTLTNAQMDELHRLTMLGKPIVMIVFAGRPLILTDALPLCDAVLMAWFPGSEGAEAIRQLVMGEEAPSGHLSMTLPHSLGQIPIHHDALTVGRPDIGDPENTYVSRYLDDECQPLFPFGFGMSYTSFEIADVNLSATEIKVGESTEISCAVENTGTCMGETVIQVYIECVHAPRLHAVRELAAFRRIRLAPRERMSLTFCLTESELTAWDCEGNREVFESDYRVYVGEDSTAPCCGSFAYCRG